MEIELTTPSLTFEFGGQGGSGQSYTAGSGIYITDSNQINAVVDNETITINEDNQLQANFKQHDYLSLERLNEYLFKVTFDEIPEYIPTNEINTGACTSFVKDGKLYRNFDWNYDERATFIVRTKDFEGIAYIDGLNGNDKLNLSLVEQLPYHLTDGCNNYGIRVSEHVLFNDFDYVGSGDNPIQLIPYKILTECNGPIKNYLEGTEFTNYLSNLYIPAQLSEAEYLLQFIVTDGTITYYVGPSNNGYEVINITLNPKLTNFKWVNRATVNRTDSDLQDRPTGIERWNAIDDSLEDLYFSKAYVAPNRLSEFIGINGTTKDSTDAELEAIYDIAHQAYLERTRNGYTWQTVHSVIYDNKGIEALYTQEEIQESEEYATVDYVDEQIADVRGDIPSLDGYATEDYVDEKLEDKADKNDLDEHVENYEIHVTLEDKENWDSKADMNDIPTAVSDLINDEGFATEDYVENYHDRTKQDTLTAGTNITIQNNVISATGGGSGIFIATYGITSYNALAAAYNAGDALFVNYPSQGSTEASYKLYAPLFEYNNGAHYIDFGPAFHTNENGSRSMQLIKIVGNNESFLWDVDTVQNTVCAPNVPNSGNYVLKSNDGILSWGTAGGGVWEYPTVVGTDMKLHQALTINKISNRLEIF